jgi:ABC-type phosphate transport system substrate-binding protein
MFNKMKALSAAIIAAGISSGAFAIAPTDTPTLELWIAGASAQDPLLAGLVPSMCDDTALTYTDTAGRAGVDFSAFFCTMSSAKVPGLVGTQRVMIHKRSRGGSAYGVAPVALAGVAGQSLTAVNVGQMEISFTTGGTVSGNNCKLDSGTRYVCNPANLVDKVVDAGVSDVEPAMFTGPNLIPIGPAYGTVVGDAGTVALTGGQLSKLKVSPMSAVTFGVVVTKDLRDALQRAQGKALTDNVADMPSLTSTQVRSLLSGAISDWSQFTVFDSASSSWKTLDQMTPSTLATTGVNVCRRDSGSGTQAQANAHFLRAPCGNGLAPVADNSGSSRHIAYLPAGAAAGQTSVDAFDSAVLDSGPGVPTVHETAASGDLTACLRDLENGRASVAPGKAWGIGIQGITTADPAFRFVAIDGVTPTLNNVASGKYFNWAVNSIQYLQSADAGAATTALAGNKKIIVDRLIANASSPTLLNTLVNKSNANIVGPAKLGALALSSKGFAPSTPFADTNPVLPINTNGPDGSLTVNSCRPATLDGVNGVNLQIISATAAN